MTGYTGAADEYEEELLKKGNNISIMFEKNSNMSGDEKSSHSKTKILAIGANKFEQSQQSPPVHSNPRNVNMTAMSAPNPIQASGFI